MRELEIEGLFNTRADGDPAWLVRTGSTESVTPAGAAELPVLQRVDGLAGEPGQGQAHELRAAQQGRGAQQRAAHALGMPPQRPVHRQHRVGAGRGGSVWRGGRCHHLTGIGVARSTGTAVTAFCGEPSISLSE